MGNRFLVSVSCSWHTTPNILTIPDGKNVPTFGPVPPLGKEWG